MWMTTMTEHTRVKIVMQFVLRKIELLPTKVIVFT